MLILLQHCHVNLPAQTFSWILATLHVKFYLQLWSHSEGIAAILRVTHIKKIIIKKIKVVVILPMIYIDL